VSYLPVAITGVTRHLNTNRTRTVKSIGITCGLSLLMAVGSAMGDEPPQATEDGAVEVNAQEIRSVRETVAQYLDHIRRGEGRDAFALTTRSSGVSWGNDFPKLRDFNRIRPLHQLGTEEHAIVISNPFHSRGRMEVFYAFLLKSEGQWLINCGGRVKPDEATWMMKGYLANPAVEVNALPDELVGQWWAVCDSTIVMSADGTGTELVVGPGGPVAGVEPEPFKWEVSGAQLLRQFADRQVTLEITRIDDDSINFRRPNDSGWGLWYRRE